MEINYLVETEFGENNERCRRSPQQIIAQEKGSAAYSWFTATQQHDVVKQVHSNQKYNCIKSVCWLRAVSAFPIFMTLSSIIFPSFCFLSCKMGLALTPYEAYQLNLCACADSEYECLGRWVLPYILRADFCHNHNLFRSIKYGGKKTESLKSLHLFWSPLNVLFISTPNNKNGFSLVKFTVGMSWWVLMMAFH